MESNICGKKVDGTATGLINIEVQVGGWIDVADEVGGAVHDGCYISLGRQRYEEKIVDPSTILGSGCVLTWPYDYLEEEA